MRVEQIKNRGTQRAHGSKCGLKGHGTTRWQGKKNGDNGQKLMWVRSVQKVVLRSPWEGGHEGT